MSKQIVKNGYDQIADQYLNERVAFKSRKYLEKLIKLLKPESKILDLGCGAGKPVAQFLTKQGFSVIGIDISKKQIQLAKQNVKSAEFKVGDMAELKTREYKVDAVIAFYSIFHIPREKHRQLLKTLASFLPKGGLILITMGVTNWQGTDKFLGHQMWWSHYGAEKNRKIINQAGFEIIFGEIDKSEEEKHLIILARKK